MIQDGTIQLYKPSQSNGGAAAVLKSGFEA